MLEKMSNSKSEILDAAAQCFMTLGVDVASIDDIARRLGATKGRIYHHFPSKGALLSAVRMRAVMFTFDAVLPVIDDTKPPAENFRNMAYHHILALLTSLPYHKVILQQLQGFQAKSTTEYERGLFSETEAERSRYQGHFRVVLKQGMENGDFREQNLSIAVSSVLILMNAPVSWFQPRLEDDENTHITIANQMADMALSALK
jgi:AcrR family transcriptional regulator